MRTHLLSALLAAGIVTSVMPMAASANSSAYTKLDLDHCTSISDEPDGGIMKCAGYKDYPAYFAEGDLRQSMRYGPAADDLIKESFESFSNFNSVGKTIEWRLDGSGRPVAAIQRWFTDGIDPKTGESSHENGGQVLVISRVAQKDDGLSCVVGYVDALANPDANDLARKVADDTAHDFACGYAEPMWEGTKGPKVSEPTRSLPDRLKQE